MGAIAGIVIAIIILLAIIAIIVFTVIVYIIINNNKGDCTCNYCEFLLIIDSVMSLDNYCNYCFRSF